MGTDCRDQEDEDQEEDEGALTIQLLHDLFERDHTADGADDVEASDPQRIIQLQHAVNDVRSCRAASSEYNHVHARSGRYLRRHSHAQQKRVENGSTTQAERARYETTDAREEEQPEKIAALQRDVAGFEALTVFHL